MDYSQIANGIQGIAPLVSGATGVAGSALASGAQTAATGNAINTQNQFWQGAQQNAQPYMQAGGAALNQLGSFYGLPGYSQIDPSQLSNMLTNLPGYQFQLQQGAQAIDRSQAAKGLLNSGATGMALQQYGQGLAGSYLNNYVAGLTGLAGQGQSTALNTNALGAQYAGNIGSAQILQGNQKAGGYSMGTGAANQFLSGLPGAINTIGRMFAGGPGGNPGLPGGGTSAAFGGNNPTLWGGPSANDLAGANPNFGMTDPNTGLPVGVNPYDASGALDQYSYTDPFSSDTGGGFNAAGGEAANGPVVTGTQSYQQPTEVAGYSASAPGGSSMPSMGQIGQGLSDVGSALNIYNGLNRGGISGYGSAALNAGKLYNNLSGSNAIPGLGPAASILGLYNGIKQGGVVGDTSAALSAASLAGSVGSAAGIGSLATLGAFAGPLGLALSPVLMGMASAPYTLGSQYYDRSRTAMQTPAGLDSAIAGYQANPGLTNNDPRELQILNQGLQAGGYLQPGQSVSSLSPAQVDQIRAAILRNDPVTRTGGGRGGAPV